MSTLIYFSIPTFVILILLEVWWASRARREGQDIKGYEPKDTFSSLSLGILNVVVSSLNKGFMLFVWWWCYQHRIFDIPVTWWSWILLLVLEDVCYYWFHRTHHEIRVLWAAHENHHSSQYYNLSTALRQSLTTPLTSIPFWLPLLFLGFSPEMVLTQQAISLLYQFWLHTEAIGSLGPLEHILNTPSHHRVHHGTNPEYIDKNHAGIFIVWDKIFGTFEPEVARVKYGLTTNIETFNPLKAGTHEWLSIARDVRNAASLREAWMYLFGPPGWRPESFQRSRRYPE
jgi:sterol desaturase/sphingolipid hydroxylase (fatty acid hydroxylase superfamily)